MQPPTHRLTALARRFGWDERFGDQVGPRAPVREAACRERPEHGREHARLGGRPEAPQASRRSADGAAATARRDAVRKLALELVVGAHEASASRLRSRARPRCTRWRTTASEHRRSPAISA